MTGASETASAVVVGGRFSGCVGFVLVLGERYPPTLKDEVTVAAKRRKPGQWREIAHSRDQIPRIMAKSHGLTNIPGMNETGSAAYRRLKAKQNKGFAT